MRIRKPHSSELNDLREVIEMLVDIAVTGETLIRKVDRLPTTDSLGASQIVNFGGTLYLNDNGTLRTFAPTT